MCFNIHSKYPQELTAKKDIPCWKTTMPYRIHKTGFCSMYRTFEYLFGKKYTTEFDINYILKRINNGFHSYSRKPIIDFVCLEATIRCIIPKGAKYYYNPFDDEYVSNQIVPIKQVRNLKQK